MTLPYFIYFMKRALEFGKVRSKTVRADIQRQAEHISSSPVIISSSLVLTFRSNYEACCHSFSTKPLICTLTQQGSLVVAQVVVSFLLSLLIYTF
jgi:hypothetical protein